VGGGLDPPEGQMGGWRRGEGLDPLGGKMGGWRVLTSQEDPDPLDPPGIYGG
jgi:hypothetical protein